MLGESSPDKPLPAISLSQQRNFIREKKKIWQVEAINNDGSNQQRGQRNYRETTKPSGEQPTKLQVQGSAELMSHPPKTWSSSFNLYRTPIKATTKQRTPSTTSEPSHSQNNTKTATWTKHKQINSITVIVDTLGRQQAVRSRTQRQQEQPWQLQSQLPGVHTFTCTPRRQEQQFYTATAALMAENIIK